MGGKLKKQLKDQMKSQSKDLEHLIDLNHKEYQPKIDEDLFKMETIQEEQETSVNEMESVSISKEDQH